MCEWVPALNKLWLACTSTIILIYILRYSIGVHTFKVQEYQTPNGSTYTTLWWQVQRLPLDLFHHTQPACTCTCNWKATYLSLQTPFTYSCSSRLRDLVVTTSHSKQADCRGIEAPASWGDLESRSRWPTFELVCELNQKQLCTKFHHHSLTHCRVMLLMRKCDRQTVKRMDEGHSQNSRRS